MPITDVTSTNLRKEEMAVSLQVIWANSLQEGAMSHMHLVLGNDNETSSFTIPVTE